jgi:GMP synthase-like glutamine amidotransferase
MKIHLFQHVPFEGLGKIADWIRERGHELSETHFYRGDQPPAAETYDWLIVMGGPMNIYEHRNHPWLPLEKRAIGEAIAAGKRVLGICLGAQLIADALGAKIYQNPEIEVGWVPVEFVGAASGSKLFAHFPKVLTPLHWHGDTFDLPPGATLLASSEGCKNQVYQVGDRIAALQFHLEVTSEDVEAWMHDAPREPGRFIQTPDEIRAGMPHINQTHPALYSLLDAMAE